jgi:hypothetical protein
MALVLVGKSRCPICDDVIETQDQIVATTHFVADRDDPLWSFSDAAMHRECFVGWDMRQAFVKRYNEVFGRTTFGNGTYREMLEDGSIVVKDRTTDPSS